MRAHESRARFSPPPRLPPQPRFARAALPAPARLFAAQRPSTPHPNPKPDPTPQVPHLDAATATKNSIRARGIAKSVRALWLGLKDAARWGAPAGHGARAPPPNAARRAMRPPPPHPHTHTARHVAGLSPIYVPMAGPHGSMALMQLEAGDMAHYSGGGRAARATA